MGWDEKLQLILDYVENHLQRKQEPIDMQEISKIAACSSGFFQKVFSYMNGISFSEYVRYRKLTLAGYDLKSTDKKVVEISYQYGYDSPTSFTKAFQKFHGVTPKEARKGDVELRIVPKMQVAVQQHYSWKLCAKSSFRLIGTSMKIPFGDENNQSKILELWNRCQKDGTFSQLIAMDQGVPKGLFGLFAYEKEPASGNMEYAIMARSDCELPDGWREIVIPKATWAMFDCIGSVPLAIQNGWKYLREEWLVKYPFQHAKCPELEWYYDGNMYAENYLSQIWIPIV